MFGRCGDGMNLDIQFTEQTKSFDVEIAEKPLLFSSPFNEVFLVGGDDDSQMYLLVTEDGQELPAVVVEELTLFDATANDIRIGKTAATDSGVTVGEKVIPSYHTTTGVKLIRNNAQLSITNVSSMVDGYDYTELQAIICSYNKNTTNSVSAEQVCIGNNLYEVRSTEKLSTVTKNHDTKTIDLGVINESGKPQLIRYFTYKEIE